MTEDEAKTKTCCGPQILTLILALSKTDGRVELTDNPGRCIASACMAWRATDNEAGPMDPARDRPPVWKAAGYCGLAGAQS